MKYHQRHKKKKKLQIQNAAGNEIKQISGGTNQAALQNKIIKWKKQLLP